jgi:hypothetical protein
VSTPAVAAENVKVAYSGIALLLIPHSTYLDQQKQKLQELSELVTNWPEAEPDPPHPSDKKLADRLADLGQWVRELEDRTMRYGWESHYHRIGVIQFRDVDVDMWEDIKGDGRARFWLD